MVTSRIAMQWQFSAGKLYGKISAPCSSFLRRAGRIRYTVIGVRCFPIDACPLLRRVVIVFASWTSGLGRTTRSHVIFLGSVGPSCEKYLHVQSHSVFTRSEFTSRSFNGYNQQNFGGCKIWQELNLAALTPIARQPN